jgi:hypothetical protein
MGAKQEVKTVAWPTDFARASWDLYGSNAGGAPLPAPAPTARGLFPDAPSPPAPLQNRLFVMAHGFRKTRFFLMAYGYENGVSRRQAAHVPTSAERAHFGEK